MAAKNLLYLVSSSRVFNKDVIPFESFSQEDSSLLYSTLYLNQKEVLEKITGIDELVFGFNEHDKEFLPEELITSSNRNIFFHDKLIAKDLVQLFSTFPQSSFPSIIIVFSNSIGIRITDIQKAYNLLNHEDNNIVVGKSTNRRVAFIGFNYFHSRLVDELYSFDFTFEQVLKKISPLDYYLFTLNGFLNVADLDDFKTLYKILSTKESIDFCSHEMHEKFTHLFIEYKELL